MVDAITQFSTIAPVSDERARNGAHATGQLIDLHDYASLVAGRIVAPAQTPAWVDAWSRNAGSSSFILRAGSPAGPSVLLPLQVERKGPIRIARFMGGTHAAGNFPALVGGPGTLAASDLARAVKAARPDVDLVYLERLCPERAGTPSPLADLPQSESPNVGLAVCLDGGFEALLDRASGKRKRKKHRSQTRKFEAAGGFRRIEARTPAEVELLLGRFFDMKADRFRKMGITDVFASDAVRAAFSHLFVDALAHSPPPFVLHALEVGGTVRAVTGSSRVGDRLICEFGAIADDEMAFTSPGEFLFYENIREACEQGFDVYDFSVGDEPYKRLWCNIETRQFDVIVPVSAKGHVLAAALRGTTSLKRAIKQNKTLWALAKRLRRQTAASAPSPSDED